MKKWNKQKNKINFNPNKAWYRAVIGVLFFWKISIELIKLFLFGVKLLSVVLSKDEKIIGDDDENEF